MKAILRFISGYVLPQWPRVIAAMASALLASALLSLNFLTIIPLLKVMVEGEGLHTWLDRRLCQTRFGIDLRTPTQQELLTGAIQGHALVVNAVADVVASRTDIRPLDLVLGLSGPDGLQDPASLLEQIAATRYPKVSLIIKGPQQPNPRSVELTELTTDQVGRPSAIIYRVVQTRALQSLRQLAKLVPKGRDNAARALVLILIGMLILTVIRCTAKFYQNYVGSKIVYVAAMRIKQDIFAHMTYMPVAAFDTHRPSDSVSRVVRDTNEISHALSVLFGPALREPLNTACFVAGAMLLNWQLTAIFLGGGPFVIMLIARFGRRMRKASHRSLQAASEMLGKLQETLAGIRIVKVYNRHEYEQSRFARITQTHLSQQLKMAKIEAAASPAMEVIGMAAACVALGLGIHWLTRMGSSEFLTFLVLLGAAADAARKSSDLWPKLQRSIAPAQRLLALLDQPREIDLPGAKTLARVSGHIEFRDVHFAYPGASRSALAGVSLVIEPGMTVAIVGANGSGKSTLVNLIPRFYDPHDGQVLVDGIDVRHVTLASLRAQIGLVTQQMVTFHDTIANNIAYGKPGATETQIIAAARQAFADEFIRQLPNGYQTVIGEGGSGLSGGQLQRIIIARAILKDPPILILDEATSQIDSDSEAKIHKAIESMLGKRTTIIIAHRFSTVMAADKIVVMYNGRIVDQGTHQQLVESCSLYQALYHTQLVH